MGVTLISGGGSSLGSEGFIKLRGDIHGSEDEENDDDAVEVKQLCGLCLLIAEIFMNFDMIIYR